MLMITNLRVMKKVEQSNKRALIEKRL